MPSRYDPASALPLRVPPALRAALDALAARLPEPLELPRNAVAVAALARGVALLGQELERDPLAVHRALAGQEPAPAPTPSATGGSSGEHPVNAPSVTGESSAAALVNAPSTTGARSARAPSRPRPRAEGAPLAAVLEGDPVLPEGVTREAVLARLLEAVQTKRISMLRACTLAGVARSRVTRWAAGEGDVTDATAARLFAVLEAPVAGP